MGLTTRLFKRARTSMAKKSKHVEEEENTADQTMEIESPTKVKKEKDDDKKVYKLLKKAAKQKGFVRNGLKDVQRRIRLGENGLVIFAGDVTPVDIMCHMPAVCEEKKIPYVYTPSRLELGHALGLKRTSLMVLVREHTEYKSQYDELMEELKSLPTPV